ncbi:MAG TPA: M61 family peptidase, partial [Planctomycetes bacterium]|nr:M61 family peptidase [Planctomycetota bacterium]
MNLVHVSALLALVASCGSLSARVPTPRSEEVLYHVSFPAPQTQHVSISTVFPTGGRDELVVSLPTWRPGRYHILNPAGTLRGFTARTPDGTQLQARKTAVSTWAITTLGAPRVVIDYTIYANSLGDRTRHVDPTHAFLSGSSVFLYSDRLRSAPLTVEVDLPTGWDIATGLERVPGREDAVAAPNYDVLVDSPLEIGLHDRVTFTVADTPHEFIYWPPGIERDDERIIEDATKIIEAQRAIFGRLPYERYVFLVHGSEARGGTEHLNSTIMQTSRAALEGSRENDDAYKGFLSLLAHEFFHTWNVKQLRPAGIHPYDYQHENLSDMLWVCEGTTSYYAALTRTRAELTKPDKYLEGLGKAAAGLLRSPATAVQSVAEASRDAWIDARNADSANSSVDIYGKGSLVSFCLDMEVRKRTENRVSLDDVMRTMFERFPLDGPGYRRQDMVAVLDELTGTEFSGWFASYVTGTDKLPYRESVGAV